MKRSIAEKTTTDDEAEILSNPMSNKQARMAAPHRQQALSMQARVPQQAPIPTHSQLKHSQPQQQFRPQQQPIPPKPSHHPMGGATHAIHPPRSQLPVQLVQQPARQFAHNSIPQQGSTSQLKHSPMSIPHQGGPHSAGAQLVQRQTMEAANALATRTRSNASNGRFHLPYAYAPNAAYGLPLFSTLRLDNGGYVAIPNTCVCQPHTHYLVLPPANRSEEANHKEERLFFLRQHASNAPDFIHYANPWLVEVFSLVLFWDPSVGYTPTSDRRMSCVLKNEDESLEPAVRFFDLPKFFVKHTGARFSLKTIQIYFTSNEDVQQEAQVGEQPGEEHFRLLLELAGEKCRPSIFSAMDLVQMLGWLDFSNVNAATFKKLFGEVLIAKLYGFMTLRRLPRGVTPAALLLYPPLLASLSVQFSVTSRDYAPDPLVTVKFRAADILAHLKGKSQMTRASGTAEASDSISVVSPQLLIHELYLADCEECGGCGVEAVVKAIKQDFDPVAFAPLAAEGERDKEIDPTKEQTKGGQRLYPFSLGIAYSNAGTFNLRHGGEWSNSLGEKLSVQAIAPSLELQPPHNFYIEVRRTIG